MDLISTIILALVQGFTEFLPISSSAHLIILSDLFGWSNNIRFDVILHLATLVAVIVYFFRDLLIITKSFFLQPLNFQNKQVNIVYKILLATLPVVIFGLLFKNFIEINLRNNLVIALSSLIFGLLLYFVDNKVNKKNIKIDNFYDISYKVAVLIGLSQVIALIPGTSRSGITITMALLLSCSYKSSARFSFLLSIPTILGAVILHFLDISLNNIDLQNFILGFIIAFVVAYLSIDFFIKITDKIGIKYFAIYRIILSLIILALMIFRLVL